MFVTQPTTQRDDGQPMAVTLPLRIPSALRAGIEPWNELPIWVPPDHPYSAQHATDSSKAFAAGLRCRPPEETVSDTWDWLCAGGSTSSPGSRPEAGLDRAKERAVLEACFGG